MTPAIYREIEDIVQKSKTFTQLLMKGGVELEEFRKNPGAVVARHGIMIPQQNHAPLQEAVNELLGRYGIKEATDLSAASPAGCAACEIGLTVALAALLILTVSAVAAVVVAFAPEVALPAVILFLSTSSAVSIVLGIIVASAGALATLLCVEVIKC